MASVMSVLSRMKGENGAVLSLSSVPGQLFGTMMRLDLIRIKDEALDVESIMLSNEALKELRAMPTIYKKFVMLNHEAPECVLIHAQNTSFSLHEIEIAFKSPAGKAFVESPVETFPQLTLS